MLRAGQIVKSIAGHDKDRFYVLVEVHERDVLIADGRERKLQKPKRKNVLHIRPTNTVIDMSMAGTDKKLRKILAEYRGDVEDEGGD